MKKYFTCNNNGDIGVHEADYLLAQTDLEINRKKYPDEEWEMFEEDGGNEHDIT